MSILPELLFFPAGEHTLVMLMQLCFQWKTVLASLLSSPKEADSCPSFPCSPVNLDIVLANLYL